MPECDTQGAVLRMNLRAAHPALFVTRFARWNDGWQELDKDGTLRAAREAANQFRSILGSVHQRRARWVGALPRAKRTGRLVTRWRVVAGLGTPSPLEVGFSFHHLYGVAVLAGSALKGLARASAEGSLSGAEIGELFGEQDSAGSVDFLDALPESPELDIDILNPHFPKYYSGRVDVARDDESPKPVRFLAVPAGKWFRFDIIGRPGCSQELVDRAWQYLVKGLTDRGVGGKTAAGYGLFDEEVGERRNRSGASGQPAARGQEAVQPGPERQAAPVPAEEQWPDATLEWSPGNKTLTARRNKQSAQARQNRADSLLDSLPPEARGRLTRNKNLKGVAVTVRRLGNALELVAVRVGR